MDLTNELEIPKEVLDEEIKSFFDSAPPLKNRDDISGKLEAFVKKNSLPSGTGGPMRVFCVTSGGTTVPLEQRCVRYIDNFSSVHQQAVRSAIAKTHAALADGLLLKLPFTTIFEYLRMLQMNAYTMPSIGPHAMLYLAAAVSDFHVPWKSRAQNSVRVWSIRYATCSGANDALSAEERLDPNGLLHIIQDRNRSKILLEKADRALRKYKMHMVIANEILSRKDEVVVVTSNDKISVHRNKSMGVDDVESALIELLVERHSTYVENSEQ